jgi:hypothetical protein
MPLSILSLIQLSTEQVAQIRDVAPDSHVICTSRSDPDFAQQLASADVVLGSLKIGKHEEAPNLKWIQLPHAGAEGWIDSPREIAITTGVGIYGIPIAEHVFAMMLALTRGIAEAVRAMPSATWRHPAHSLEIHGSTCAVIGLGNIGREVAKRAAAFGMLEPIIETQWLGKAEVLQIFRISRIGVVAGSRVTEGELRPKADIVVTRDGQEVYKGKLTSLKHFNQEVPTVSAPSECGIASGDFRAWRVGDKIEATIEVSVERKMPTAQTRQ